MIRMGLIHVVLLFGTNNVQTAGLTAEHIHLHSIGARLVLAARIFYAMFIWVSKLTVSEFLKRLARASWTKSYQRGLVFIRYFLLFTFCVVVIATISECQPFDHYWQVVPDPGPRCRQGFAQLISMGVADIITDILLVVWPIPIIVRSRMPMKRKLSTVLLFSLSLCLIGITATRVPKVIQHHGRQQYRTVWASVEILASAAVSNAVVLGSFVRDRGIKRNKYRTNTTMDSIDRVPTRRPTLTTLPGDSDEDLFREIGCRLPQELVEPKSPLARPAPVATSSTDYFMSSASPSSPLADEHNDGYKISAIQLDQSASEEPTSPHDSDDTFPKPKSMIAPESPRLTIVPPLATRNASFFDVGGLLESGPQSSTSGQTTLQSPSSSQPSSITQTGVVSQDFASHSFSRPQSSSVVATAPAMPSPSLRTFRNPFAEFRRASRPRESEDIDMDRESQVQGGRERTRGSSSSAASAAVTDTSAAAATASPRASRPRGPQRMSSQPRFLTQRGGSDMILQDAGGLLR